MSLPEISGAVKRLLRLSIATALWLTVEEGGCRLAGRQLLYGPTGLTSCFWLASSLAMRCPSAWR
jgi:hypothetical protein